MTLTLYFDLGSEDGNIYTRHKYANLNEIHEVLLNLFNNYKLQWDPEDYDHKDGWIIWSWDLASTKDCRVGWIEK